MNPRTLARLRAPWLVLMLAATAWLGSHAAKIGIEHDNASLRSSDAGDLESYAAFKSTFGSDEDILVAIGHPRLLERDGLALVEELTQRIGAIDGVRKAWSLANVEEIVSGAGGAVPKPLLPRARHGAPAEGATSGGAAGALDLDAAVREAPAALDRNPDFTGWLVSKDRRAAGIVVEIEDRPDDTEYRARMVAALRGLAPLAAGRGAELHLTGVPVQKIDVSAFVDRDQKILLPAAVVMLGIVLAVFFRHLSGVAIPLGVAGITVLWTIGLYEATGHATNAITALLPPVLLVVALATTVHVYDAWVAGHRPLFDSPAGHRPPSDGATSSGDARFDRALLAARAVFVPGLLCAVTTSQGFVSLSVSDMPAVRQFGLFAAFGTLVAFVVAMTVVPAVLGRLSPPRHRASDEHGWTLRLLDACSRLATSRPVPVLLVFAAVTVVLAAGIPRVRSNTDLVGFLHEDAPLRRDTEWIDANLAGTLPFDFVVQRRDGEPLLGLDQWQRLAALEDWIRQQPHVADVTSPVSLLRQIHRAESGSGRLELPADEETLVEELDLLDGSGHDLVRRFAAPEMQRLRMTVRLHAVGSAVSAPLVRSIREKARETLGPDVALEPTGSLWQVVRDSESLVRQQVQSFGSAIVLVVAAIGLLLRSVAFTLVAMIPNVMPIVWTGGLMGYTGIELSTGTAMIASAVLGLVVDDTIHYLSYYRELRRATGDDAVTALRRTSRAVGAPVTVSSTSLVLGFWVGGLGSFLPTVYFSLLTGLTMITGVLCDLLVLPASLVLLERDRRPRG